MNGDCTDLSPHNLAELKNDRNLTALFCDLDRKYFNYSGKSAVKYQPIF